MMGRRAAGATSCGAVAFCGLPGYLGLHDDHVGVIYWGDKEPSV
jgi:hypothetical protein